MTVELKIMTRNENTALPRVLRIISRQGCVLKKLVLQPIEEEKVLELSVLIDCTEVPLRLVKLLQKQILVLDVKMDQDNIAMAV